MAFDTFDTDAVVTSGITFTGGGLIATATAGGLNTSRIAEALEGKTSGKWYVEFTCGGLSGNVDGCGVVYSIGIGTGFMGSAPGGVSADTGWSFYTNSHVTNLGSTQSAVNNTTYTTGDVIGVAIDLDNKRIWFRKNTGSWIGTTGSPDPATNTNGFTLAYTAGQRVFPAANLSGSGAKFTANFGASAFTGTVPSGFTSGWTSTSLSTGYFGSFTTNGFGGYNQTPSQNKVMVSQYVSNFSGAVNNVFIAYAASAVSDLKCVMYADNGSGAPGSLLAVSSAVSTGAPGEISFTFGSPPTLVNGTTYYIGVISDAAAGLGTNATAQPATTTTQTWTVADSYASPASTFPGSPTTSSFRIPLRVYSVPATNVSLSGASGAGAAGSFSIEVDVSLTLTGVSSAGAVGSLVQNPNILLAGVSAAGAPGIATPAYDRSVALSGAHATGASGAVGGNDEIDLSGVSAFGGPGVVVAQPEKFDYFPVLRLMRSTPVPTIGAMGDEPVVTIGALPASGIKPISLAVNLVGVSAAGAQAHINILRNVRVPLVGVASQGAAGLVVAA